MHRMYVRQAKDRLTRLKERVRVESVVIFFAVAIGAEYGTFAAFETA